MKLALIAVLAACDNGGATPDWSRMITQPKLQPFGASDQFDDGRAMQPLPDGVVARDWIADPERRTGRTSAGSDVGELPVPVTRALLVRGRDRFRIYCAACHGVAGDGDSAVAHNMERRRPPSLHEPRIVALAPGAIYRAVADGYGLMPSYAGLLDVDDRWAVVAYVETLQFAWTAKLDTLPARARGELAGRLR